MNRIVFFSRKPRKTGNFSVEIYFKLLQQELKNDYIVVNKQVPFESSGLLKRLINIFFVFCNRGQVNHITGDIYYVSLLLNRNKTIITYLDCVSLYRYSGFKKKLIELFWYKLPSKCSDYIVAISEATKQDLLKLNYFKLKAISVVYISINDIFIRNNKIFNSNKPRLLQIGTAPNKNLLRICKSLIGINCELVIIGNVEESIKSFMIDNNICYSILDTPLSDDDVYNEYVKADIVLMLSTLEGFGMPILESQSVGRVLLASNISSIPEVAGRNGALFVNPYDENDIKNGIIELIKNKVLRDRLIINGFENIKRFNILKAKDQYSVIYNKILNK